MRVKYSMSILFTTMSSLKAGVWEIFGSNLVQHFVFMTCDILQQLERLFIRTQLAGLYNLKNVSEVTAPTII
uniref:AlNc14C201G8685 protein n=3 Tax=Albugo laibachii Nc14 TaxID=890382 RepID=F0WQL9_9STRA|nr:AlNc14C201G8685 [Albugo laibachii Nc14]|eukprot:CCA23628.1 AlNc14C201G8685 [Albugo laibachii Nc14]